MAQGIVLVTAGRADPGEKFALATVTAWKLLAVGGAVGICWTAGRSIVAFQALVTGWLAWIGSGLLLSVPPADESPPAVALLVTTVLWLLPAVILRPRREQLLRLRARPSAILLPLALAAAVPLAIYAIGQGDLATTGAPGEPANAASIPYVTCALGIVLAVQATFAALRPHASRWLPRFVASAAVSAGLAALVWPHDLGSFGRIWGAVLIGWALAFAAAAEVEARRQTDMGTLRT